MTQLIDLGKIRFSYAGEYNSGTSYELNDVVKYGGHIYVYTNGTASTGNVPTNTTYWAVMTQGMNFLGVYSSSTSYKPGDTVSHGGNLYLALNPSLGQLPPNATYWSRIASGIQYEGAYNGSTAYQKDDVVSYSGSAYIALQDHTNYLPTNTTYWAKLVDGTYPAQAGNENKILKTDGTSASWTDAPSLADLTLSDDLVVGDKTYLGPGAFTFAAAGDADLTNPALVVRFDNGQSEDSFAQIAFQNDDSTSSTDIIAYMDNGTDSEGWVGMGIAGSSFNDQTYGITGPGDGYIFHNTKPGKTGNLVIATGDAGTENKIVLAAGGFASGNTQMEITPDVNVHIEIPTPSTSSTTGALTVVGGVGIQGDMNVQGNMNIIGNFTFGGGSTTAENLSVSNPLVFVGNANNADTLDLGLIGEYSTTVSAITATVTNKALTSNVATLTTSSAHTYLVGDWVVITGVDATFNGTYQITTVPTSTTFTYAKTASNVTSAAVSPTGSASVSARRKFAGVVRDASDAKLKFFQDATTKPSSTVDFTEAGLTYADIKVDDVEADVVTTTGNMTVGGTLTSTGLVTTNGGITVPSGQTLTVSGSLSATGGVNLSGTVDVQELREQVANVTLSTNTGILDWTAGNIYYIDSTSSTNADLTLDLQGVPTDINKIMTINVIVNQGATARNVGTFQVNTSTVSVKWAGGSTPTPTSNKIDIYSFTLHRLSGGTWNVYGSAVVNF